MPTDGFEIERLVLIELERRTQREIARDKLGARKENAQKEQAVAGKSRIPVEVMQEAVRQGNQGRVLELTIAAAAAAGAIALRFGPGAVDTVPKVVRSVRNMAGVSQTFPQGGGPRTFNAAKSLELLLRRRLPFGPARTGAGDFFQGTEG